MASDRVNLAEGSLSADLIAQQNFSVSRRGFDPDEVRAFLAKVAAELLHLHDRQGALETALRDAEYRVAHPTLDEETLLSALGEETSHVLRSAHEAAADLKGRAEENASRILKEAHLQADVLRGDAESVLARRTEEAETVAVRILETARAEAERLADQARQQAKAIRGQSESERKAMIDGASATREKILTNLARKRKVAVVQVEQLLAGRERLLESYQVVRETLDQVTLELAQAETAARAAADMVRLRPVAQEDPDTLELPVAVADSLGPASEAPVAGKREERVESRERGEREEHVEREERGAHVEREEADDIEAEAVVVVDPVAAEAQDVEVSAGIAAAVAVEESGTHPSSSHWPGSPTPVAPRPGVSFDVSAQRADSARGGVLRSDGDVAAPAAQGTADPAVEAPLPVPEPAMVDAAAPDVDVPGVPAPALDPECPAGEAGPAAATSVETLFARIRADHEAAVERARETLAQPGADESPAREIPGAPAVGAGAERAVNEGERSAVAAGAERAVNQVERSAATPAGSADHGHPVSDADEALLQRRDEVVGPIEAALTRRLKRALQDEQNDLLDRLRGMRMRPTVALLLPTRGEHAARFAEASRPFLGQAAAAGATFVGGLLGGEPVAGGEGLEELDVLADNLAGAIVAPLRRRLEEVLVAAGGEDRVVLGESVGGAYREWKTQRIELTAADHITSAFAGGAFAATPAGTPLRWLVEDNDGPCPDCDDNVLAGDLPKGERFPTGQRHPPAHTGCRCLLVPKA